MTEARIKNKVRGLQKRYAKLLGTVKKEVLDRIEADITRYSKLMGKPVYYSKVIISENDPTGRAIPVGAASFGPAIRKEKDGKVVYMPTFDPPKEIRFI